MNKKSFAFFVCIYLFLYAINSLTPMSFGDDYLYAFIWQGHSMFIPLTEDAVRVSSWNELLASQWSLYFTWGGRVVGQSLTLWLAGWGNRGFNSL